jgi:hypothetical protein
LLGKSVRDQRSTIGCNPAQGAIFLGGTFAIIGVGIGALLPSHTKDVIYFSSMNGFEVWLSNEHATLPLR